MQDGRSFRLLFGLLSGIFEFVSVLGRHHQITNYHQAIHIPGSHITGKADINDAFML